MAGVMIARALDRLIKVCGPIDHFTVQQRHEALHVPDLRRRNGVDIAIPDSNIGALTCLKRAGTGVTE
jgi:hypothetical protein